MRIKSFYEEGGQLRPLEITLQLWPGVPEWVFTGGTDSALKDAIYRIKSALKAAGFEVLSHKQVVISLSPYYEKKFSRGLDLALCVAYLAASSQLPTSWLEVISKSVVFAQVDLDGSVRKPPLYPTLLTENVWVTGQQEDAPYFQGHWVTISHLSELKKDPPKMQWKSWPDSLQFSPDPVVLDLKIDPEWVKPLAVAALGSFHVLWAGISGAGKTTAARILNALLPPLAPTQQAQLIERHLVESQPIPSRLWRPFIAPHHTIPLHSLIGGGHKPNGGELARAHGGTLLLDEFFEFEMRTQDALREPLEQKQIRVARGPWQKTFPFDAQVVATCNLCPCGRWVLGMPIPSCRFSWKKCRSYQPRISGPLLDRFELVFWVTRPLKPSPSETRALSVQAIRDQLEEKRQQPLPTWDDSSLTWMHSHPLWPYLSTRRQNAWTKAAQIITLWEGKTTISRQSVELAYQWAVEPFLRLQDPAQWNLA